MKTITSDVRFFDPHPGLAGARDRIPGDVRMVALQLEGTTGTVQDAMNRLCEAWPSGYFADHPPEDRIELGVDMSGWGYIGLSEGRYPSSPGNRWRVIKYEPLDTTPAGEEGGERA